MNRRKALGILASAGLASLPAMAPAASDVKRVGIFTTGPRPREQRLEWEARLGAVLRDYGFRVGENLELVWFEVGQRDADRLLAPTAREIARARLDCVITYGSPYTSELQRATATLPIVTYVGDPVAAGFARSIARPGGNITGVHQGQAETALKQVELLKTMLPGLPCVGWIAPRLELAWLPTFERAASVVGVGVHTVMAEIGPPNAAGRRLDATRFRNDFARLRARGCRGAHFFGNLSELIELTAALALEHRIGLAYSGDEPDKVVELDGMLLTYGAKLRRGENQSRQAAIVGRILRGERPAEIPFEGPSRYALAVNLNTARKIGVVVPRVVLVLADRVIG